MTSGCGIGKAVGFGGKAPDLVIQMLISCCITATRPTAESLGERYAAIEALLDRGDRPGALGEFDRIRREYETWGALVHLRFEQDTTDETAKADQDYADTLDPEATRLEIGIKRRLLADADQPGLAALTGAHALRLWQTDITTFDPRITGELEQEAKLASRYTSLIAAAKIDFRGETTNLAGLEPFGEDPDRATREAAARARWGFYADHGDELDTLYDDLVHLRHGMARTLGYETYTALGYRRMRRVDYGPAEVARYRDEVVAHVVPLVARLLAQRSEAMGWNQLRIWDEPLIDPAGNPRPAGDYDYLVGAAERMFDDLDPRLGSFYRAMRGGELMDLKNRPGKAGGGFCTSFPTVGMPFIFANFNGTHGDLNVFTHEMGHAFQNAESRAQPMVDYLWPTSESAEINSMGLEFLTYPVIGHMVGEAEAAHASDRRAELSAVWGVCRSLPARGLCQPRCDSGRTPRDVAHARSALSALGRLRRYRFSEQGRALAGQAAYLPAAVLLYRLHARAVLRVAVLGSGAARSGGCDEPLCRAMRAWRLGAVPGTGARRRAGFALCPRRACRCCRCGCK
jgi:M3 family oligoendopeptidase